MSDYPTRSVRKLEDIPNVGKATAEDLRLIGIDVPAQLVGRAPFDLYLTLNRVSGRRQDPCVLDVFMAAVHYMEGGPVLPWWAFTDERKVLLKEKPTLSEELVESVSNR